MLNHLTQIRNYFCHDFLRISSSLLYHWPTENYHRTDLLDKGDKSKKGSLYLQYCDTDNTHNPYC